MDNEDLVEIEEIDIPKLVRHVDKGGAWLEVPIILMLLLNLKPDKFTQWSRISGDSIYLDELVGDDDTLLRRFLYLYGTEADTTEVLDYGESADFIRALPTNEEGAPVTIH